MPVTLPSTVTTANVDQTTDDPRAARADIKTLMDAVNTLLGQINALGIMQAGDGLMLAAQGAGTKDKLTIKLNGGHLQVDASGLAVKDGGITGVKLANGISAPGNSKYYGTNNTGTLGFFSLAASGPQKLKAQFFTTPGTSNFTVPTGVTEVMVEMVGGGGGAGASNAGQVAGAGAGGYSRKMVTGLTPGNNISTTVGAGGTAGNAPSGNGGTGGTSSFGAFCSATGGAGTVANSGTPGVGGVGVGGDLNAHGSAGDWTDTGHGGNGGASRFGGAPIGGVGAVGAAGEYGAGAAGGHSAAGVSGQAGAAGLVIVSWVEP